MRLDQNVSALFLPRARTAADENSNGEAMSPTETPQQSNYRLHNSTTGGDVSYMRAHAPNKASTLWKPIKLHSGNCVTVLVAVKYKLGVEDSSLRYQKNRTSAGAAVAPCYK